MSDDAFGVRVAVHDHCLNCGSSVALVGRGRLLCDGCECSRGRISKELRAFLTKFVQEFGRPDQPVVLRTGMVWKPARPGDEAVTATQPKGSLK